MWRKVILQMSRQSGISRATSYRMAWNLTRLPCSTGNLAYAQVFCLVLAGDAASTRRFSEIMMAGCIPTFVGPPYHSMPFVEDVDYRDAAIFFNVTNYSAWLETPMQVSSEAGSGSLLGHLPKSALHLVP